MASRRLSKYEDMMLVSCPQRYKDSKEYLVSSSLFHRRFDDDGYLADNNGDRYHGYEYGYWLMCGAGDQEYSFALPFHFPANRIPREPVCLPNRYAPIPWIGGDNPWPLNHLDRVEGPRGGGYVGRRVELSALRVSGHLRCGVLNPIAVDQSWDNVRLVLVLDLMPRVDRIARRYTDVGGNLFNDPPVAGAWVAANRNQGTARQFSPLAMARYRVLLDKVYRVERDLRVTDVAVGAKHTHTEISVPAQDLTFNPLGTQVEFMRYNDRAVALPGNRSVQLTPNIIPLGVAPGAFAFGPPPGPLLPVASYSQTAQVDVQRASTITGVTSVVARLDALVVASTTAVPASNQIDGGTDIVNTVAAGRDGTHFDEMVDLDGYFTKFADDGMIVSGAIFMFLISDNNAAYVAFPDLVDPPNGVPDESFISSTVWYVTQ